MFVNLRKQWMSDFFPTTLSLEGPRSRSKHMPKQLPVVPCVEGSPCSGLLGLKQRGYHEYDTSAFKSVEVPRFVQSFRSLEEAMFPKDHVLLTAAGASGEEWEMIEDANLELFYDKFNRKRLG